MKKRDIAGAALLLVYLLAVGLLTGPSLYQLLVGRLPAPKLELVPLVDIVKVMTDPSSPGLGAAANILGNAALLAPLGFLLPLFWRWFGSAKRTILFALCLSVSIEMIQLIAGGVTSVDDVLLNTLGAALGYACARLLLHAAPRLAPRGAGRAQWAYPLACWLLVIVLFTVSDMALLS